MGEERNMKGATWLNSPSPRAFVDWHLDYLTGQQATALFLFYFFNSKEWNAVNQVNSKLKREEIQLQPTVFLRPSFRKPVMWNLKYESVSTSTVKHAIMT